MQWYAVKKCIKGNYYWYWQKTYRVGRHVKTLNKYIGPAHTVSPPFGLPSQVSIMRPVRLPPATTIPIPFPEPVHARIDSKTIDYALGIVLKDCASTSFLDFGWNTRKVTEHKNWRTFDKIEKITTTFVIHFTNDRQGNWYDPSSDKINIVDQQFWYATKGNTVEYRYYRTRCHELVHWTGGKKRIDRLDMERWGDEKYAIEELTAELGACLLMKILSYSENENQEFHAQYFQHWLERAGNRDEAIKLATKRAKEAVEYILENGGVS